MQYPLVNNAYLQAQIDGDATFGQQLLQAFRHTAADTLHQLAQADSAVTRAEALHRLRGASISIGAEALADYCIFWEADSASDTRQLDTLIRQTLSALDALLGNVTV